MESLKFFLNSSKIKKVFENLKIDRIVKIHTI
jgi:hypothetical protein